MAEKQALFNHYIINAKESRERRQDISRSFYKQGLEPHFFTAVMGKELSNEERAKYDGSQGLLLPGELGCALSHLNVYKALLASDELYAYIFEDDIELANNFAQIFPGIDAFLRKETEPCIIRLVPYPEVHKDIVEIQPDIWLREELSGTGTFAYIINRAAAGHILYA